MSSGTNKERITENNTKIDAIKTRALNLPSGISLENIGQLPAPITHLRSYRDNSGDLNLAWQNPADVSFSGKVVVVRKKDTYPTLPIYSQDYDIVNNTNTIHYDQQTIEPNQKYGFCVLPMNSQEYVQTQMTGTNRVIDNSVDIRGEFVEIQLPEELQGQTDLYSYMDDDGVVYLSSKNSSVQGIWRLDKTQNALIKIYESGYNWQYFCEDKNRNVFISSSVSGTGIVKYDINNATCTQVYSTGYRWGAMYCDNDNNIFAIGSAGSSDGALKYNTSTGVFEKVYSGNVSDHKYWFEDEYGNVFVGPDAYISSSKPLLKWNGTTFVSKYSGGSTNTYTQQFIDSEGTLFLSGSWETAPLRYNRSTDSFSGTGLSVGKYTFFETSNGKLFAMLSYYKSYGGTLSVGSNMIYEYNRTNNTFYAINFTNKTYSTASDGVANFFEYNGKVFLFFNARYEPFTNGMYQYNDTTDTFDLMFTFDPYTSASCVFYKDKYNNLFAFLRYTGTSNYYTTSTNSYLYDNENNVFINVSATISSTTYTGLQKVVELEAGELYISDINTSGPSGLYKYDYTNQVFTKVNNYGYNYRLIKDDENNAIFGTAVYSNGSYVYSILYDKNAGTYTQTSQNGKNGIKFAGDMFATTYKIYHPSTDTIEATSGNYTTLMNDISDEASYNYGLSLATGTKYLIYNK